ncbi:MAG: hypothetical protein WB630_01285, partial [Candidatus Acidiferrales bacterium]
MSFKHVASNALHCMRVGLATLALFQFTVGASLASAAPTPPPQDSPDNDTRTPIKHVIVIIGENRSFDHVFATYVPKPGESVHNLLSEKIINADGSRGPNFEKAHQLAAINV